MPAVIDTFSECLVPNCGISNVMSEASTTAWSTPSTSLPKIKAYFFPSANSGENFSRLTELTVCSTLTISYPTERKWLTTSIVLSECSQGTLSSAPRADLWISADGGTAHIPQSQSLSILKESQVRNADPTLCALRMLSSTTTTPI